MAFTPTKIIESVDFTPEEEQKIMADFFENNSYADEADGEDFPDDGEPDE